MLFILLLFCSIDARTFLKQFIWALEGDVFSKVFYCGVEYVKDRCLEGQNRNNIEFILLDSSNPCHYKIHNLVSLLSQDVTGF
jgi:hypothetical protein